MLEISKPFLDVRISTDFLISEIRFPTLSDVRNMAISGYQNDIFWHSALFADIRKSFFDIE